MTRVRCIAAVLAGLAAANLVADATATPRELPRLVFVSRQPGPDGIPGLGPAGRTFAAGGRLLLRERGGAVRPLLPPDRFFDVSDPCATWDGKRVVFAATLGREAPWRIWIVDADGTGLEPVTHDDRAADVASAGFTTSRWQRYDDLDPCVLPDGRICFATTRWPFRGQHEELPVTNLYVVALGGKPVRITSERNGGEEPSIDPRTGRVVYARWWFNRFMPSNEAANGVTLERAHAVPMDTIDLWTAGSITPDGDGIKLAGGDARSHATLMAYQPVVATDGSLYGIFAENRNLFPKPERTGLVRYAGGLGEAERLVGPGTAAGGTAAAPLALGNGRVLFSWAPEGSRDFGLYVSRSKQARPEKVVDFEGTAELDAAVFESRPRPPLIPVQFPNDPAPLPPSTLAAVTDRQTNTFRFDDLNVFSNAAVDAPIPNAPPLDLGLRIRFYGVLSRPAVAGGDSLVLVREEPVEASGAVHVDEVSADMPVFEQLVDARGQVVRSARGPAHVPGFNFGRLGTGTKCVGCHTGHSLIPVATNNFRAKWFNAAPSAVVTASSQGSGAPQAAVDRRARGAPGSVAWVAASASGEWVQLAWKRTIEVRELVIYAVAADFSAGTSLRVRRATVSFWRDGREVKRLDVRRDLSPKGTRIACDPVRVDAIRVIPEQLSGLVQGQHVAALAEIEAIARLVEEPLVPGD